MKRRLVLFAPALILPHRRLLASPRLLRGAGAAVCSPITLVNHAQIAGALNGGSITNVDMTGVNFIVINGAQSDVGTKYVPTDSALNTYVGLTARDQTTFQSYNRLFYCASPTVTGSMTFNYGGTSSFSCAQIAGFSGVKASSPFDVENGNTSLSSLTIQTGLATPSAVHSLVVAGACGASAAGASIDSGLNITDQSSFIGGTAFSGALAYIIETTIVGKNPTWTFTTIGGGSVTIASFQSAC